MEKREAEPKINSKLTSRGHAMQPPVLADRIRVRGARGYSLKGRPGGLPDCLKHGRSKEGRKAENMPQTSQPKSAMPHVCPCVPCSSSCQCLSPHLGKGKDRRRLPAHHHAKAGLLQRFHACVGVCVCGREVCVGEGAMLAKARTVVCARSPPLGKLPVIGFLSGLQPRGR